MIRHRLTLILLFFMSASALNSAPNGNNWWRTYNDVDFNADDFVDGDSFHLKVLIGRGNQNWSIRLYGIDCAETDQRFPDRLVWQAEAMGLADGAAVLRWGEKAKERTVDLLKQAKRIDLHVKKNGKEKTQKAAGQTERYYGIVELEMPGGERVLLHNLLLQEGLAVPGALHAPWPPETEARNGEEKAREAFRRDNDRTTREAKNAKRGFWGEPAPSRR